MCGVKILLENPYVFVHIMDNYAYAKVYDKVLKDIKDLLISFGFVFSDYEKPYHYYRKLIATESDMKEVERFVEQIRKKLAL